MGSATPDERQLLSRLAAGDPSVNGHIVDALLTPTIRALEHIPSLAFRTRGDPDILQDAATDAILDFLENWHRYDPERAPLATYIRMAAHRDALNALSMRWRRNRTRDAYEADVRLSPSDGNLSLDGVAYAQVNLLDDKVWDRVAEIVTDPTERAFVLLMLDGERGRETYADVLGIPEDTKSTPRPGDPDGTDTGWTQVEGRAVG